MQNNLRWILLTLVFYSTSTLAVDDEWKYSVGLSMSQLSLDVYEKGETDPEGILTDDYVILPILGLESEIFSFSDNGWGYKYAVNFGFFSMKTQEVDLEDVDLGTSAKGYFLYAMPVAVYDFFKGKAESPLVVGFGLGLGFLEASGDIILTESTPQIKHKFNFSEFTYAYGLFFEHEIGDFSYGFSLYGPELDEGGYEYNLFDFEVVVRKKFRI